MKSKGIVLRYGVLLLVLLMLDQLSAQSLEFAQSGTFQLADPVLEYDSILFQHKATVSIHLAFENTQFFYTLDGQEPSTSSIPYQQPITIEESTLLSIRAFHPDCQSSGVITEQFIKVSPALNINPLTLKNAPKSPYASNGLKALFDLKKGSVDFKDGKWLGFQGDDLEVVLKSEQAVAFKSLTLSGLVNASAWIFPIQSLGIYTSNDGQDFKLVEQQTYQEGKQPFDSGLHFWQIDFAPQKAKFVKIVAQNQGILPEWHQGAGEQAWLFVDEILLR